MRPSPVRRSMIIAAAIGALLPVLATTPAYADDGGIAGLLGDPVTVADGALTDLSPAADLTDGADGRIMIIRGLVGSVAELRLTGLDPAAAGHTVGVHVHTGRCVAGAGAAAGPHYNHDRATGREPAEISARTEVWLDITVDEHGRGHASTLVPFVVPSAGAGIGSVVVHEHPTDHGGMAGGRLACLPLEPS
ncbi:superoxide dismutase family protein [Microlunatus speluncae]|uniref:superoxide dismutase family protein n=1 Tax=Microlunatus speluncae TaxID=2594267 RepID=UPI0012661BA1|nr:superoxide dismutase family protein [Microlunatus speluncae]